MPKLSLLAPVLVLAACDVGSVLPGEGGGGGGGGATPDASGGGGGGGGGTVDAPGGGGATPLSVTFTTSATPNGVYDPSHCVAVWITNQGGTFVKTIGRWADVRRQHLVAWTQAAGAADADAVSGATRVGYAQPLTVTWDLKDRQGATVPDGTYTIRMEVTDTNANQAGQNNQGTFTFVKGTQPQTQNGLSNGGFTNVTIQFTP